MPPWLGWRPLGTLQESEHKLDLIHPCHTDSHIHRETRQTENCPFWAKSPAQKRKRFKHWTSSHVLVTAPLLFLSDVVCLLSPTLSAPGQPSPPLVCPEPLATYPLLLQSGPHDATHLPTCNMGQIPTLLEGFPLPVGKLRLSALPLSIISPVSYPGPDTHTPGLSPEHWAECSLQVILIVSRAAGTPPSPSHAVFT